MTAFSADSIESRTVVGYQEISLEKGYAMLTPCFVDTTNKTYPIDNIIMEGVADAEATVQVVNPDGTWGAQGFWYNEFVEDDGTVLPAGWMTADGSESVAIELTPGQGVFFWTNSDARAKCIGKVADDIQMSPAQGYSMLGNATPVEVEIDSLVVEDVADAEATVQVVNADGTWGAQGFWYNEFVEDNGTVLPAGWMTADGSASVAIKLAPGQSVFFWTKSTNAKVTLPSALK